MRGVERKKNIPDIRRTDIRREPQQKPVRIQFEANTCPVPGRDEDGEDTAQRFVRLMAGTDIAHNSVINVLKRNQSVRRYQ